jgi:CRISPR-associated protein Cas2
MYFSISYDISNNKTRRLAVKLCKQAGLVRLQRSVFTGASNSSRIRKLERELTPHLQKDKDSLSIQPLNAGAFRKLRLIGQHPKKREIARTEWIVFF